MFGSLSMFATLYQCLEPYLNVWSVIHVWNLVNVWNVISVFGTLPVFGSLSMFRTFSMFGTLHQCLEPYQSTSSIIPMMVKVSAECLCLIFADPTLYTCKTHGKLQDPRQGSCKMFVGLHMRQTDWKEHLFPFEEARLDLEVQEADIDSVRRRCGVVSQQTDSQRP